MDANYTDYLKKKNHALKGKIKKSPKSRVQKIDLIRYSYILITDMKFMQRGE